MESVDSNGFAPKIPLVVHNGMKNSVNTRIAAQLSSTEDMDNSEYSHTLAEFLAGHNELMQEELFRGQRLPLPTKTEVHSDISRFLIHTLTTYITVQHLPLIVSNQAGVCTETNTLRWPDLVIADRPTWEDLDQYDQMCIFSPRETPLLVAEIVSDDRRRDYFQKRAEYALAEIDEYWIIDPEKQIVCVLSHPENETGYTQRDLYPGDYLTSEQLPGFELSVSEILCPPPFTDLLKLVAEAKARAEAAEVRAETAEEKTRLVTMRLRELYTFCL